MTQKKIDNSLYNYFKGGVNEALPLEYAIRASESIFPEKMECLRALNQEMREEWHALGASDDLIDSEQFLDFSWDQVQVERVLVHQHARVWYEKTLEMLKKGVGIIHTNYRQRFLDIDLPSTRFFRVCDLLNGCDIIKVMEEISVGLKNSRRYDKNSIIPAGEYRLSVRTPIPLNPVMTYLPVEATTDRYFGVAFDLSQGCSPAEFQAQVNEFLYQYAVCREVYYDGMDVSGISRELITTTLSSKLAGEIGKQTIERIDGFASVLSGLYCWDLCRQGGYRLEDAITKTEGCYNEIFGKISIESIRKNYKRAAAEIKKIGNKFQLIC